MLKNVSVLDADRAQSLTASKVEINREFKFDDIAENILQKPYDKIRGDFYGEAGIIPSEGEPQPLWYYISQADNVLKSTLKTAVDSSGKGSFLAALAGNDQVTGSTFADFINAGSGVDNIQGNKGKDTFAFFEYDYTNDTKQITVDVISDFKVGEDKILVLDKDFNELRYDAAGKGAGTMWFDKGVLWLNFDNAAGVADGGVRLLGVKSFGRSDLGVTDAWAEVLPA